MSRLNEAEMDGHWRLADGRTIGYRCYGAPEGLPVLALHGTPGSRLKFTATDADARALGIRVIAPDRWGYGISDVHPAPTLAAFASDMRALADVLGLGSFALMGVSGGGPYAAAAAALMGRRITALALVSPVGPIVGAPAARDMSALHKFCFLTLARLPGVVELIFRGFRFYLRISPDQAMRLAMARAARPDRDMIKLPAVRKRLAATFTEGLRPGLSGPAIDLALFGAPWDISLADISAPARVWIGTEDKNVPFQAALDLCTQLPACAPSVLGGEGHLWVALHYGDVLGWIKQAMQGRG